MRLQDLGILRFQGWKEEEQLGDTIEKQVRKGN